MLDKKFLLICIVLINTYRELFSSIPIDLTQKKYTYRLIQKKCAPID